MPAPGVYTRRAGHPYQAKAVADLPVELRLLAEASLLSDDPVRTIFVVPPQTFLQKTGGPGGVRRLPVQALLFTARGVLHIQGKNPAGQPGQAVYLRSDSLIYAHLSLVLLYGRLELCGVPGDALTRIVVEYNTVRHDLIRPELNRLLFLMGEPAHAAQPNDGMTHTLLEKIEQHSLKFRNGLQIHALQPGDGLLGFVFQPRILKRYWRVFHRLAAPASLIALTDRALILIEEGPANTTSYGWRFTFCPRKNITGVETRPNGVWQDMQVHLAKGEVKANHRLMLENDAAQTWLSIWQRHAQ
jgi:hypothetical protein